jgi:putative flippase GtrA
MVSLTGRLHSKEFQRLARFLAVGALGTVLDFGLLTLLKSIGILTLLANTVAFTAGVLNNFTWNRLWTFSDIRNSDWRVQFGQFLAVSLIGLALNNAILLTTETFLGSLLGRDEYGYLPAKVLATGVVVFWNYFANRNWTFRK